MSTLPPRLCDEDCNHCPLVTHPNARHLAAILNAAYDAFGDELLTLLNATCPNLTVCPDCRIDDFCHLEGGCAVAGQQKP